LYNKPGRLQLIGGSIGADVVVGNGTIVSDVGVRWQHGASIVQAKGTAGAKTFALQDEQQLQTQRDEVSALRVEVAELRDADASTRAELGTLREQITALREEVVMRGANPGVLKTDDGGDPPPANYPAVKFSWETVPVFFHADNFTGDFNDNALQQLAKYPIVTIEKWMGSLASCKAGGWSPCCGDGGVCLEDRAVANFKRLKALNANVSTVLYLNSVLNFPQYKLAKEMAAHPEYWLRDKNDAVIGLYGDFGPANMTVRP
jgi:hypothetical protein